MSNCRTGCSTKDHKTYAECLQDSNLHVNTGDAGRGTPQKKWDGELAAYKKARAQGIQPAGTTIKAVEDAMKKSDKAAKAFDATTGGFK